MSPPLISVVIPAYNVENFIREAIESVFNQTYRPIELLVVDDGSFDDTSKIVNAMSSEVPDDIKYRLIQIKKNQGAAAALNRGFSEALGEHVSWLSADDVMINPTMLKTQTDLMNTFDADFSFWSGFYQGETIDTATKVEGTPLFIESSIDHPVFLALRIAYHNPIHGSTSMIRKSWMEQNGNFDPELGNIDADADLWMRYIIRGARTISILGAPIFYRIHSNQTSRNGTAMLWGTELTRVRLLRVLKSHPDFDHILMMIWPAILNVIIRGDEIRRFKPETTLELARHITTNNFRGIIDASAHKQAERIVAEMSDLGPLFQEDVCRMSRTREFTGFKKWFEATYVE